MRNRPTLSVIMPNYNYGHLINRALTAVLSQSVRPDEVVVVDDCSTDNSVEVIESFARRDPIIKLLRNETNQGVEQTLNRAFDASSGEYIYSGGSDDFVRPGFFEKSLAMLQAHPQAALSCAYHSVIVDGTGLIKENPSHWCSEPRYFSPDEFAKTVRFGGIPGHSSIFKRSAYIEAGRFLNDLRWHADWFTMLVMAYRHGICHIPEPLALLRVAPTTYSGAGMRDPIAQREVLTNLLRRLLSADYSDVAPYFAKSGILSTYGRDLIRAVLDMPEGWSDDLLALVPVETIEARLGQSDRQECLLAAHLWAERHRHTGDISTLIGALGRNNSFIQWAAACALDREFGSGRLRLPRRGHGHPTTWDKVMRRMPLINRMRNGWLRRQAWNLIQPILYSLLAHPRNEFRTAASAALNRFAEPSQLAA